MKNPFGKKAVPEKTQREIDARAGKQGILWAAKRFPWIHVTSLSDKCETRYRDLSSVTSRDLYQSDYVRPYPIVTQVNIKKQGELGTTRKITINLIAFTDEQLKQLSKCYFIPRMGVRVQWGWSQSALGDGIPPLITDRKLSDPVAICLMNAQSAKYPNYNGLQGVVANFTYGLNTNGYWDCVVEVVSATDSFATAKVHEYSCPCARDFQNETPDGGDAKPSTENKSSLYTTLYDLFKNFKPTSAIYYPLLREGVLNPDSINMAQYAYNGPARTEKGGDDSSWYEGSFFGVTVNQPDTVEAYISWYALEQAINRNTAPQSGGKYVLGKLDSNGIVLKGHPKVESADPRICILPGSNKANTIAKLKAVARTTPSAVTSEGVVLGNIMLNVVFLMNELSQIESSAGTLRDFLTNVLAKINDACGNLWEFEVVSSTENCTDELKEPVLTVVDVKVYEPATEYVIPSLAIGAKASVLRDLKLDMKMTDQMKTQALYANAGPTSTKTPAGGGCGANTFVGFGLKGDEDIKNEAAPPALDPLKCDCEKGSPNTPPTPPTFDELFTKLGNNVDTTSVSAAKSALVEEYAKSANDKATDDHCVGAPLPFEFSFTLDGIGGFAFGQIVTSDRIPDQVRKAYHFQVTAVEHSITPNDWTTSVNTVCRYK